MPDPSFFSPENFGVSPTPWVPPFSTFMKSPLSRETILEPDPLDSDHLEHVATGMQLSNQWRSILFLCYMAPLTHCNFPFSIQPNKNPCQRETIWGVCPGRSTSCRCREYTTWCIGIWAGAVPRNCHWMRSERGSLVTKMVGIIPAPGNAS